MEAKRLFHLLSASALSALALSSCQDYDFMDEAAIQKELTANEYTKNFVARYGEIAPNHTWGFENLTASVVPSARITRADDYSGVSAGVVNVNRNQWAAMQGGSFIDEAIADEVQIPGWPNDDDYYYYDDGSQTLLGASQSWPSDGNLRPVGDVTEYEIQYVSAWFRSHKITNPEQYRENLHLSDFFIQNISADNDQWNYSSLSGKTGKNGENITLVQKSNLPANVTLNEQTETYTLQYNLDHLCFKPMGASREVDGSWTHVNNFNAGNSNHDPENNANSNKNRVIQYITSSGTEDFACHPSLDTNTELDYIYDWVLVRLEWDEPNMADGKTHHRVGYYLAFDFAASKDEVAVSGDDYYSNWIVKITPAHFSSMADSRRIMCEDLGNTCDFDFNDVVFDVRYETTGDKTDAIIKLQASGGTLPIYIGVDPASNPMYETHRMLGQNNSSLTPINVGSSVCAVAIYRLENVSSTNPNDIPIYVKSSGNSASAPTSGVYQISPVRPGTSEAPQKFATDCSVQWLKEKVFIEKGYPLFKNWVCNSNNARMMSKARSIETPWYNVIGDPSSIYSYVKSEWHESYADYLANKEQPVVEKEEVVEEATDILEQKDVYEHAFTFTDGSCNLSSLVPSTGSVFDVEITLNMTEGEGGSGQIQYGENNDSSNVFSLSASSTQTLTISNVTKAELTYLSLSVYYMAERIQSCSVKFIVKQ